jgi:hypothetical protein
MEKPFDVGTVDQDAGTGHQDSCEQGEELRGTEHLTRAAGPS